MSNRICQEGEFGRNVDLTGRPASKSHDLVVEECRLSYLKRGGTLLSSTPPESHRFSAHQFMIIIIGETSVTTGRGLFVHVDFPAGRFAHRNLPAEIVDASPHHCRSLATNQYICGDGSTFRCAITPAFSFYARPGVQNIRSAKAAKEKARPAVLVTGS